MTSSALVDLKKIEAAIEPIARMHGAEIYELGFQREPSGFVLRVLIEKLGSQENEWSTEKSAISLDLCSEISREISPALDVLDLISPKYILEVGSPGVERKLNRFADFKRFVSQHVKIKLSSPSNGQKVLDGTLDRVFAEEEGAAPRAVVRIGSKEYPFALHEVVSAHLVFDFGPTPKPGKTKKQENAGVVSKKEKKSKEKSEANNKK